jgi:hypothetical protein
MNHFGRGRTRKSALKRPPRPRQSERARMQRMARIRHAMTGEETRRKAEITLPKLKFMEQEAK